MTLAFWFWLVVAIWLIWGVWKGVKSKSYSVDDPILFLLFVFVGFALFGAPWGTLVK